MATATAQESGLLTAAMPVIQQHEGRRLSVYKDSLGIPTIGIGINLEALGVEALCISIGANYAALLAGTSELTGAQCDWLYQQVAINVVEWLTIIFPDFFEYSQNRQIALLDMGYNLGETRFRGFTGMIGAIYRHMWGVAGTEALDSEWARQVGGRAIQDANFLSEG